MLSWPSLTIFSKFETINLDINIFSRILIGYEQPTYNPCYKWHHGVVAITIAAQLNKVQDGNKFLRSAIPQK